MVLPPAENPLRIEVEAFASTEGLSLQVPVEIEGIRLIPDLVGVTGCATVLPETARNLTAYLEDLP
jgi:hypothetical protein